MVGHRHPVAGNRTGNRDTGVLHVLMLLLEINTCHRFKTVVVQTRKSLRSGDLTAVERAKSQTTVGAADVTHQGVLSHFILRKSKFLILLDIGGLKKPIKPLLSIVDGYSNPTSKTLKDRTIVRAK